MATSKRKADRSHTKSNDSVAEFITNTFGTLTFLFIFLLLIVIWLIWNLGFIPSLTPVDPVPFSGLELFLAVFAIFLSIAVLISQKRQAKREKISQQVEFEVNLRAEKEITKVLQLLKEIQEKLGIDHKDPELKKMMEDLDTEKLHEEERLAEGES